MSNSSYKSKLEKKVPTESSMKLVQKAIADIEPNINS